jgi:RNA polymerase sigma factor (TIGR02999 family)
MILCGEGMRSATANRRAWRNRKASGNPDIAVRRPQVARAKCAMPDDASQNDLDALKTTLAAAERGDAAAAPALFAALYRELHRLARKQLHANASGLTLGATTLLHEAYLDLSRRGVVFPDRARFFAYAARAMRGLIIDYVRERRAIKRGVEFQLTTLDADKADAAQRGADDDLLPLGEALDTLAGAEPALAELVELKFFCGLNFAEIATMRGVSERTVQRDWAKARLFLHHVLRDDV